VIRLVFLYFILYTAFYLSFKEYCMQTAVTKRGQTVIPAAIRKRYHIEEGDSLVWIDDGTTIRVVPVASDPIRALRGSGRGEGLMSALLTIRQEDRTRE
jgi:AbrB family looped-hinge helix DNA binding protein